LLIPVIASFLILEILVQTFLKEGIGYLFQSLFQKYKYMSENGLTQSLPLFTILVFVCLNGELPNDRCRRQGNVLPGHAEPGPPV
jgi:hypothetical protein